MADQNIPVDYQTQLEQLQRRRALAEMLQKQAFQSFQQPTQFAGNVPVKQSPFAHIANALSGFLGQKIGADADTQIGGVRKTLEEDQQKELLSLTQAPDKNAAVAQALASKNPQVRALAASMQKQMQDAAGKAGDALKDRDLSTALRVYRTGQAPGADYQPPAVPGPTFGKEGENPYALIPKVGGGVDLKWAPQGTRVSVDARAAGKEGEMALDVLKADIKERQARALAAKETLSSNAVALDALNQGAQAGGMEGFKQALRKIGQGFGVQADETTSTEQLSMALGNAVLAKARALAPVTAEDVKRLQSILGSVETDPTALVKMLTVYNGIAAKELQDFNRYLKTQSENLTNPHARDLLSGQGIGFEMQAPPGNTTQSLRAIAELMARGGDPSMFAVGGEPIAKGSTFDLPGSGLPEKGAKPQAPIVGLTPQESEELARLRRKYGR